MKREQGKRCTRRWNRLFPAIALAALLLAVVSGAPAAVRAQACEDTYTVEPGDTLYSIAEQCGINYVILVNINYEISDPGLIRPGQVIRLTAEVPLKAYEQPVSGPAQPGGLEDGVYVVRSGDSLARIAMLYHTSVYDLYMANPGLKADPIIYTGQTIELPWDASHRKGWVGVSTLSPSYRDSIQARILDFPPYAPVEFRLHQKVVDGKYSGFYNPDYYYEYEKAVTDARGQARVMIDVPYYARSDETWVVEVFTVDLAKKDTVQAVGPDMLIP